MDKFVLMLFKDKKIQNELEENGFVIIPFLKPDEVTHLNEFYTKVHNGEEPPHFIENIHMTTWCEDFTYKESVSKNLMSIFTRSSELYFENFRRLNNVFIVKKSGLQTTFKVHQDWNVVDETTYQSVNVWVPLHDVDQSTGALWILKGSHRINRKIRGAGYLFPDYSNYTNDLEKVAISVKLKAGEAIVFYHSVIHGSPPNLSNESRKAACFSVIPKKAPLCIYFQKSQNDALQQHEPNDEFIFQYDKLRVEAALNPPTKNPIKIHDSYINKKVELKELEVFLNSKKCFFSFLNYKTNKN